MSWSIDRRRKCFIRRPSESKVVAGGFDRRAGAGVSRGELLDHRSVASGPSISFGRVGVPLRFKHFPIRTRSLRNSRRIDPPGADACQEWGQHRGVSAVHRGAVRSAAVPVAGGGLFSVAAVLVSHVGACASINERQQQPFIFYLHPWEIDAEQPRFNASWLSIPPLYKSARMRGAVARTHW